MATERLKLVTSFGELRAGMIVVLKSCGECDGKHRTMLVGYRANTTGFLISGEFLECDGWTYAPGMPCDLSWGNADLEPVITPLTVERGALFHVEDRLEASQSDTTKVPRRQVRQGVR